MLPSSSKLVLEAMKGMQKEATFGKDMLNFREEGQNKQLSIIEQLEQPSSKVLQQEVSTSPGNYSGVQLKLSKIKLVNTNLTLVLCTTNFVSFETCQCEIVTFGFLSGLVTR